MASILIVDDLEFMRYSEAMILRDAGYGISGEAIDGEEGVEKYFKFKPDLVLMDITMPKMNGIEATKQIIKKDPNAKIVICSALGQPKVIVQAIDAGAKEFIVLPFKKQRLISAIEKALKN